MGSRVSTVLVLLLIAGCGKDPNDVDCTLVAEPSVVVEVTDAATGSFIAQGAEGTVQEDAYLDTLLAYETGRSLAGAYERGGTYQVHVTHPGYQDWIRDGVQVSDGACHVQTRRLLAEMVPVG